MRGLVLTNWQRRRLVSQLAQTSDVRAYQRTPAILGVGRRRPVAHAARAPDVSRQSMRDWLEDCREGHDSAAPLDAPRPGRPRLRTKESSALPEALLVVPPEQCGRAATIRTAPLLQEQLRKGCGQVMGGTTLPRQSH